MSVRTSGPAGLQLRPASLDVLNSLGTLLPSPAHPKLGFTTSQLGFADQSLCLIVVSHVISCPLYAISY